MKQIKIHQSLAVRSLAALAFVAGLFALGAVAHAAPTFQGCYLDNATRALPVMLMASNATVETCTAMAAEHGYPLAGLQNGGQCFAGYSVDYAPYMLLSNQEVACHFMRCTANSAQWCGGAWINNVYNTHVDEGFNGYADCYTDSELRMLPARLIQSGATRASCIAAASAQGYAFAGLQNGGECFGGDSAGYSWGATPVSDNQCNMPCTSHPHDICGGVWRNSVYYARGTFNARLTLKNSSSASQDLLWPGQSAVVHVTSNRAGSTKLYVGVRDAVTKQTLGACAPGLNNCDVTVPYTNRAARDLEAYALYIDTTRSPIINMQATWTKTIRWNTNVALTLTVDKGTASLGENATVTATADRNMAMTSDYAIEIFDLTSSVRVGLCHTSICAVTRNYATAGLHEYRALVSEGEGYLLPEVMLAQAGSQFITWTGTGYRISLNDQGVATTNVNVWPTPYYIIVYNYDTHASEVCGSGMSCSLNPTKFSCDDPLIAFISTLPTYPNDLPPPAVQANSLMVNAQVGCPN